MIKQQITPQDAVDYLNDLVKRDPDAIRFLMIHKVQCNQALADHPSCQVDGYSRQDGQCCVGMLGVINGLFGWQEKDHYGCIEAIVDRQGDVPVLHGFQLAEGCKD